MISYGYLASLKGERCNEFMEEVLSAKIITYYLACHITTLQCKLGLLVCLCRSQNCNLQPYEVILVSTDQFSYLHVTDMGNLSRSYGQAIC